MAGEFASRITVDKIAHLLPRCLQAWRHGIRDRLRRCAASELFDANPPRADCTSATATRSARAWARRLSLCWFPPGWMYFAHIGDSRIYYLPADDGSLMQLTHDDTHVGWLVPKGRDQRARSTHASAAQRPPKGSRRGPSVRRPRKSARFRMQPGDIFLLCTDGLDRRPLRSTTERTSARHRRTTGNR